MMAGFGHATRVHPRSRGRTWSRSGLDRAMLVIVGAVCAIAGFFVLGIILGPVAIVCGWFALGRSWAGARSAPALAALLLGAIDTVLSLIRISGATALNGMF
ncbi:small hydrophobic protein [Streptomyces huasconensis]|uniref:Small hydrophobic protein n=1 Tax=Streptomyces huasconensis TaxID=1854574 RepID=A0ABV3LRG6_9ACTN